MGFNRLLAVAPKRCQPFDRDRKGMMLGEGSGVLLLERLDHAQARGAMIYAEVLGYGLSCDANHMTIPSVDGISRVIRSALEDAKVRPNEIDYISAHGTGTPANDRTECAAIRAVFGEQTDILPVSSIKSMIGHTMGAASALEAIACALVVKNDRLPPTINFETPDPECSIDCVPNRSRSHRVSIALNNSFAFGGNNACVVFQKVGHN
jgi:3-oxoacyl-[acyl-carrier-protein] synthase II